MARRGERWQRKGNRDEQAVGGADRERQRIDGQSRLDRQDVARNRADRRGGQGARDQPGGNRGGGHRQYLQAIDAQHRRAVGAEHLQCRKPRALARKIAGDPVADPDPGDHQCGEADERQELPHTLDKAPRARRPVATVGHLPACVGEGRAQPLAHGHRIGTGGQPDAIFAFVKAAGLDQLRRGKIAEADDRHRAQRKAFAQPVGFVGDDAVDAEGFVAEFHRAADRQVEPRREILADPDRPRGRRAAARAAFEPHRAVQRIGGIDRLQLGEQRAAVRRVRHRAHPHRRRRRAGTAQPGELGLARLPLRQAELQVAAQDRLPARRQFGGDAARQAADGGQRRDAEEQTHRQQAQPANPRRQIAPRDTPQGADGKHQIRCSPFPFVSSEVETPIDVARSFAVSRLRSTRTGLNCGSIIVPRSARRASRRRGRNGLPVRGRG